MLNSRFRTWYFLLALAACAPRPAAAHPFDESYENVVVALDSYKKMADENLDDIELQYMYADMLIMANKLDQSEQIIKQRIIARDPDYDMAYYLLSEVYYRKKQYKKSLEPLKHITAGDMKDDVFVVEATVYLQLKQPKKCLEKAQAAIKADKTNPNGQLYVGLALRDMGRPGEALQHIEISLLMDPYQPLVYDWLKELYEQELSLEDQLERLQRIVKDMPYDSDFAIRVRNDIKTLKRRIEEKKSKGKKK